MPSGSKAAVFQDEFREDLRFWIDTNRKVALKIMDLVEAVLRDPFTGLGKPEPLKFKYQNSWSRRITEEHRLVYQVRDDVVVFMQCRLHY